MTARTKLGIGTVQWGVPYGIANRDGVASVHAVGQMLALARDAGVRVLDTAALYGDAESVLGAHGLDGFRIVTKTPRFALPAVTDAGRLRDTFDQSLRRLNVAAVHGLLIHHADDLCVPGGDRLVRAMRALQADGRVGKIGVSVYDGTQLEAVLQVFRPDLVQLPLSVLDQRLLQGGWLDRLQALGIEIHVRSVFLQGLLLMPPAEVPPYFEPIRPQLARWHAAAGEQGLTPLQAAMVFVRDIPAVDSLLVGVQDMAQLQTCIAGCALNRRFDARGLGCDDPAFINPALWKTQ